VAAVLQEVLGIQAHNTCLIRLGDISKHNLHKQTRQVKAPINPT
jgi:hypothetical protein